MEGILLEDTLDLNNIHLSGESFDTNSSFPPVPIPRWVLRYRAVIHIGSIL